MQLAGVLAGGTIRLPAFQRGVMESSKISKKETAPIGVFTALAWESAAVRSVLKRVTQVEERVWRGFAGDQEFRVITGGSGTRPTRPNMGRIFNTAGFCLVSHWCF